jgi:4-hydroxyphenylpyruvate dioxygenase
MSNGNGKINFQSMNLPKERRNRKSRNILTFMEDRIHTLQSTDDIIKTIGQLKARGRIFVSASSYIWGNPGTIGWAYENDEEDLNELEKLAIMVDADEGYLLSNFTKPVQDRPTLFLKLYRGWSQRFWRRNFSPIWIHRERAGIARNAIKNFFYIMWKITNELGLLLAMLC